jgi:sortase A
VGGLGRTLIALGVLVLLFVAYQLWGTGIHEARAQHDLRRQFERSTTTTVDVQPGDTIPPTTAPPATPTGSAIAIIRIPRIGVDKAVVEGVGVPDLKKGPGHYPGTPLPGQVGNASIAGHRTTYGAPFYRLNELEPGDPILITTREGSFRYRVDATTVVKPTQVEVLAPSKDARLTLTTCNPRFSARQRLVVTATLVTDPAETTPTPPTTAPPTTATTATTVRPEKPQAAFEEPSLSGDRSAAGPTVLWGLLAALVALGVWFAGRRWKRWVAYLLGAPVFLVVLFVFYENVARLLPANI